MFEPLVLALILFSINTFYHSLAWRILLAGRRSADGVFTAALIFSFGMLFTAAAVAYFPFFDPLFFATFLLVTASFIGYLYAFPNAVRPPLRLAVPVTVAAGLLFVSFVSDTAHALGAIGAATLFFLLVAVYLIIRKQHHLAPERRRIANITLSLAVTAPCLAGIGAAVSLILLHTAPFVAAIIGSFLLVGILLFFSQRISRDVPLPPTFVVTLAISTVLLPPVWLALFPLRVIIARLVAPDAFFSALWGGALAITHLLALALLWLSGHIHRLFFLRQAALEQAAESFRARAATATDQRTLLHAWDEALHSVLPSGAEVRYLVFAPDDTRLAELGRKRVADPDLERSIITEWFLETGEALLFRRAAPSGLLEESCARIGADIVIPLRESGMLFGLVVIRAPKANFAVARAAALMSTAATDHYTRLALLNLVVQKERLLREVQYFAETDKMVSVIAHEVRTPLTAVMFNLDVLAEALRKGEPCDTEYLEISRRELKRLNETIEKMLLFGRDIKLEPREGSFDTFVADLAQTYAGSPVPVRFECTSSLTARLDWDRLRHIVTNLVNNAVQAMGEDRAGEVTVSCAEAGDLIRIVVRDTGPGIPANIRDNIFDPFFTTKREGNGLGLAICRKIVRLMGGVIELTASRPGETIFTVSLPRIIG